MTKAQPISHAATDPKVSCPIVCGEYMRASGFFFEGCRETYLVTARHNILPTNSDTLKTGEFGSSFSTDDFLPLVHVYLRTSSGFEVKSIDVRDCSGIRQTPEIDVIAIPIDFHPEEYGYQIWNAKALAAPTDSPESLDIIGFNGDCFPNSDNNYEIELYRESIRNPVTLQLVNELVGDDDLSRYGLTAMAIDENLVDSYNGLSGAPVLGNELVGIHASDVSLPERVFEETGYDEFRVTVYWRARLLAKLCD